MKTALAVISITNLAERHLRLIEDYPNRFIILISITNLAERHLRPPRTPPRSRRAQARYINHESSRKAFETSGPSSRLSRREDRISITNLAERHLRHRERVYRFNQHHRISITNLAERHLRLSMAAFQSGHGDVDINHESSRKAFETVHGSYRPPPRQCRISITNLAERHLRLPLALPR